MQKAELKGEIKKYRGNTGKLDTLRMDLLIEGKPSPSPIGVEFTIQQSLSPF